MSATSVTGLSGAGIAAHKGVKNPVYVPMLSPHVVAAGVATTAGGGTVTVTFPTPLTGSKTNYIVVLTALGGTTVAKVTTQTDNSDDNFASFVITGHASTDHNYIVVTAGNA